MRKAPPIPDDPNKLYMTIKAIADRAGTQPSVIKHQYRRGKFTGYYIGGIILVPKWEAERFLSTYKLRRYTKRSPAMPNSKAEPLS